MEIASLCLVKVLRDLKFEMRSEVKGIEEVHAFNNLIMHIYHYIIIIIILTRRRFSVVVVVEWCCFSSFLLLL